MAARISGTSQHTGTNYLNYPRPQAQQPQAHQTRPSPLLPLEPCRLPNHPTPPSSKHFLPSTGELAHPPTPTNIRSHQYVTPQRPTPTTWRLDRSIHDSRCGVQDVSSRCEPFAQLPQPPAHDHQTAVPLNVNLHSSIVQCKPPAIACLCDVNAACCDLLPTVWLSSCFGAVGLPCFAS